MTLLQKIFQDLYSISFRLGIIVSDFWKIIKWINHDRVDEILNRTLQDQ